MSTLIRVNVTKVNGTARPATEPWLITSGMIMPGSVRSLTADDAGTAPILKLKSPSGPISVQLSGTLTDFLASLEGGNGSILNVEVAVDGQSALTPAERRPINPIDILYPIKAKTVANAATAAIVTCATPKGTRKYELVQTLEELHTLANTEDEVTPLGALIAKYNTLAATADRMAYTKSNGDAALAPITALGLQFLAAAPANGKLWVTDAAGVLTAISVGSFAATLLAANAIGDLQYAFVSANQVANIGTTSSAALSITPLATSNTYSDAAVNAAFTDLTGKVKAVIDLYEAKINALLTELRLTRVIKP